MAKKHIVTSDPLFEVDNYSSGINEIGDIERSLSKDPYWDEIVLDSEISQVEPTGQTTLFYDATTEPPTPEEFNSIEAYNAAYYSWCGNHPELANHGFADELDRLIPANAKTGVFIVEKADASLNLGIISNTSESGFFVDWLNFGQSSEDINFLCGTNCFNNWERDQWEIEKLAIAPQSLIDKFLVANPDFSLTKKIKVTGEDKGFKVGQKLFSNHPYGDFIVEVAEYPVVSGDWINYKSICTTSNQLLACIFLSNNPQPPKAENYSTDFHYQKAVDKYKQSILSRDQSAIDKLAIAPQSLIDKFLAANPDFSLKNEDRGFNIDGKIVIPNDWEDKGGLWDTYPQYWVYNNEPCFYDGKNIYTQNKHEIISDQIKQKYLSPRWYLSYLQLETEKSQKQAIGKKLLNQFKVNKIYLHSSGKKVKIEKILKSKATGFVEVYFEGNPILERVAIADLSFLPVPQCKDFTSFEGFDKAYQEWLSNCFDDSQQLSSKEIWDQFLGETQEEICSNTLHYLQVSEDLNSELKPQDSNNLLAPESSLKIIQKLNEFSVTDSQELNNTQTLEPTNQNQENLTSTQSAFPAQVHQSPGTVQDLNTQNQVFGLKPCDVLPTAAPASPSLRILQDLSITDYEQFLGDSEWLDIVGTIRKSYQLRNSAHPTNESDCLLLPTPTTYPRGSTGCRPAGTNRLEQKLKPFIQKGDKLHPAVSGWMMGFPSGWVEQVLADTGELLSIQPPLIPLLATTSIIGATVSTSMDEPLHRSSPQLLLNECVTSQNLQESLTSTNTDKQTTTHNKPWYEGKFNIGDQVVWQKYPDLIYEIVKPEKGGHVVVELKSDSESAPLRKRVAVIYLTPTTTTTRFNIGDRVKLFDDDVVEIRSLKSDGIVTTGNFFVPFDHIRENLTPTIPTTATTKIKALTLHQPWASLVGKFKNYETRGKATNYRGKIAIHAAVRQQDTGYWLGEFADLSKDFLGENVPYGAVVAIADLTDCIKMTEEFISQQSDLELRCGLWEIGRYAWKLENVEFLPEPIPARGMLGLWDIELELPEGNRQELGVRSQEIGISFQSPVISHQSSVTKPNFKTGEYVLNGRVGQIIEDSPGEYFVVKYSLINSNDLKCYFWGQDDQLIDQIVIAPPELVAQFVRENKEDSAQELKTKKTKVASGSLAPFLENKKLKDGTIVTYPRVHGERDKLNYDHWRWGYYYEVKIGGEWKNKSMPVPSKIAPLVREMIDKKYSVGRIKEFILQSKTKKHKPE